MFYKLKSTKGFSLIEMMVVLAIMGMLATTAKPTFDGMQARARRVEGTTHLGSFHKYLKLYYLDHKSYTYDIGKLGLSNLKSTYYDVGFHGWAYQGIRASNSLGANTGCPNSHTCRGNYGMWFCCLYSGTPSTNPNTCKDGRGIKASPPDATHFLVGASGNIDNDPATDSLGINEKGEIFKSATTDDVLRSATTSTSPTTGNSVCQCIAGDSSNSTGCRVKIN